MERITIRLPDDIHDQIRDSAKLTRRSLNSEIVRAIEFYLQNAPELALFKEEEKKNLPK